MANAAALIDEGLWRRDRAFQRVPRLAQCTFCQVLSQKDLDTAGVLTLYPELLAKGCDELTVDQLRDDFKVLEELRFMYVDWDTDELLIRSYVRRVSVRSPNAWKSVPKNARMIASPKLRSVLAAELRRLNRKDADLLADEIDPNGTPSEPHPDPIGNPSERDNPSRPLPDPPSQVPVPVLVSLSVGGSVGEEPSPFCPAHPSGIDGDCFACGQARRLFPARKAEWDSAVTASRAAVAAARQEMIDSCPLCDEYGDITLDDSVRKCDHQASAHA